MNARILAVVALSCCSIALADDPKPATKAPAAPAAPATTQPSPEQMMKAMEEAATPGPEHKELAKMAGEWEVTMKYLDWSDPSMQKWNTSKGEEKCEVVLGGRYVFGIFKGEFNGQKFEGQGFHGYNKTTKQYESSWADTMSTCQMLYTGTLDANKVLKMSATYTDPMGGGKRESRMVSQIIDDNHRTFSMFEVEGGQEMKVMEATYVRKGAATTAKPLTDKISDDAHKKAADAVKEAEKKAKEAADKIKKLEPTK